MDLPPQTKLIILASILGAILGALIQRAISSSIFVPAGIHWLGLERSEYCERYGTRKYRARLGPFAGGYDRLKACRMTAVEIHGRMVKPTYCEDKNGVWGTWIVDFNEASCRPLWAGFTDMGCTAPGSGRRRFEAHLINIRHVNNWDSMCSSTPAEFNGLHFDGAMSCVDKGKLYGSIKGSLSGSWDIEDRKCG